MSATYFQMLLQTDRNTEKKRDNGRTMEKQRK